MSRKGHVAPGRLTLMQAKIGMIIATLFLLFGLILGFVVLQNSPQSEGGARLVILGFFLIWTVACTTMIVFYARMLSKAGNAVDNSLVDFQIDGRNEEIPPGGSADFADRLRQLEGLKRDGLITEAEYRDTREQIVRERW